MNDSKNMAEAALYMGVSYKTLKRMLERAGIKTFKSIYNRAEVKVKTEDLDRLKANPLYEAEAMTA